MHPGFYTRTLRLLLAAPPCLLQTALQQPQLPMKVCCARGPCLQWVPSRQARGRPHHASYKRQDLCWSCSTKMMLVMQNLEARRHHRLIVARAPLQCQDPYQLLLPLEQGMRRQCLLCLVSGLQCTLSPPCCSLVRGTSNEPVHLNVH